MPRHETKPADKSKGELRRVPAVKQESHHTTRQATGPSAGSTVHSAPPHPIPQATFLPSPCRKSPKNKKKKKFPLDGPGQSRAIARNQVSGHYKAHQPCQESKDRFDFCMNTNAVLTFPGRAESTNIEKIRYENQNDSSTFPTER